MLRGNHLRKVSSACQAKSNRRILHVITSLGLGGAQASMTRLLPGQLAAGWEPSVISLAAPDDYAGAVSDLDIPLIWIGAASAPGLLMRVPKFRRLVKRINPAIIHCWMYHAAFMGAFCDPGPLRVAGIRHSLSHRESDSLSTRWAIDYLRDKPFDAFVYNSTAAFIQHSDAGFPSQRGVVIPNGFDHRRFRRSLRDGRAFRESINVEPTVPLVTAIGRYHPVKDQAGVVAAFAIAAKQHKSVHLAMAGSSVALDNAELAEAVRSSGCAERIHLLGPQVDLVPILSAADVLVSGSRGESFPNVLAEAMLGECLVAATDVGDSADIIGEENLLMQPGRPGELASAISQLLSLPYDHQRFIGQRNRERIIGLFSLERESASYLTLYERLLFSGGGELGGAESTGGQRGRAWEDVEDSRPVMGAASEAPTALKGMPYA